MGSFKTKPVGDGEKETNMRSGSGGEKKRTKRTHKTSNGPKDARGGGEEGLKAVNSKSSNAKIPKTKTGVTASKA